MRFSFPVSLLALLLGAMLLPACTASKPTSLYVLMERAPEKEPREKACPSAELERVLFPGYLDYSGILTREEPNRLRVSELHHWAEPLQESFTRVLAGNLESRICGEEIAVVSGRSQTDSDYRIRVKVLRFEPVRRQHVILRARWRVMAAGSEKAQRTRLSSYKHPVEGKDHQAVAAAMSEAAASLSWDIAQGLGKLAAKQ